MDANQAPKSAGLRYAKLALVVFVIGWVVSWSYREHLFQWLASPLVQNWQAPPRPLPPPAPTSLFTAYLRVATLGALLFSLPFTALASWALARPHSFESLKRTGPLFVATSYVAVVVSTFLAQSVFVPMALRELLAEWAALEPDGIGNYITLVFRELVSTSIVFELAVVAVFAGRAYANPSFSSSSSSRPK